MMYGGSAFTAFCFLFSIFISVSQGCPNGYDGSPCKDIQPPVLKCPDNIITNTSKGKPTSSIVWSVQVTDNSVDVDPNSVIQVRSSHESGQELPIGRTAIRVTATDGAGNVASCDFEVEVKDTEPPTCSTCPSDIFIEETRSEVRVNWERPHCSDNSGFPPTVYSNIHRGALFKVPSSVLVQYTLRDMSDNSKIGCSFRIIVKVKQCPNFPPPRNGALVCTHWHERSTVCAVFCKSGTDFEFNPPMLYYCSEGQWRFFGLPGVPYEAKTPWPNCSDQARPSAIKMLGLPYYYYNGDAREPNVQEAIKSQFHSLMRLPYIPPGFCSFQPKCTKDSILVSPGVTG
ncbi:sushi, von Willebrand factor type A, EGF and pentraxin domain-containing protein 1-like [Oculina patagonica]